MLLGNFNLLLLVEVVAPVTVETTVAVPIDGSEPMTDSMTPSMTISGSRSP